MLNGFVGESREEDGAELVEGGGVGETSTFGVRGHGEVVVVV